VSTATKVAPTSTHSGRRFPAPSSSDDNPIANTLARHAWTEITYAQNPRRAEAVRSRMSKRKIAASLGVSATAAGECIRRVRRACLGWPLPEGLTDEALECRLYPPPAVAAKDRRPQPDWAVVHRELRRPGVTLQLLWEEHRAGYPDGYGYSRFCDLYRAFEVRLSPTMRQSHVAGERLFVDYAGTTLEAIDASTGCARSMRSCHDARNGKTNSFSLRLRRRPGANLPSIPGCRRRPQTLLAKLTRGMVAKAISRSY
jgi:hypothetical protein